MQNLIIAVEQACIALASDLVPSGSQNKATQGPRVATATTTTTSTQVSTITCAPGFRPEGDVCQENTCVCEHGQEKHGLGCAPTDDTVGCVAEACKDGFSNAPDWTENCVPKVCGCANGSGAREQDCPASYVMKCVAPCNNGYHLDENDACALNLCRCDHGTPTGGIGCAADGSTVGCEVGSCRPGYHNADADGRECTSNMCKCDFGEPLTDPSKCESHEITPGCAAGMCDPGYHTEAGDRCVENKCTCLHGNEATGAACTTDGAEQCASCPTAGYQLNGITCVGNTCRCPHVAPACGPPRATVVVRGPRRCRSCDPGYHPDIENPWVCSLNRCRCTDGTPAKGTDCPTPFADKCVAPCNEGYYLQGTVCEEKACTCANGVGATGKDCPGQGEARCAGPCHNGFFLNVDNKCEKLTSTALPASTSSAAPPVASGGEKSTSVPVEQTANKTTSPGEPADEKAHETSTGAPTVKILPVVPVPPTNPSTPEPFTWSPISNVTYDPRTNGLQLPVKSGLPRNDQELQPVLLASSQQRNKGQTEGKIDEDETSCC